MTDKREIAPATLRVDLSEGGITVKYLDGREVFYHGVPARVEGELKAPPGKDVHVLVTDEDGEEGVLFYVNDRKTADEILEDSGVGRLLVGDDQTAQVFPGVEAERRGYGHLIRADHDVVDGRTFVFVEDEFGESSYELVPPSEAGEGTDAEA